jgi:hypothetical protein
MIIQPARRGRVLKKIVVKLVVVLLLKEMGLQLIYISSNNTALLYASLLETTKFLSHNLEIMFLSHYNLAS